MLESPGTYDLHPDDAWARLKSRLRKPTELAVLKYVAAWREREARSRNVPRSRVLKDDAIYEIAQQQPKDVEAMSRLRTIPKGWERSASGAAIIEAVNAALALPKTEMPHAPKHMHVPEGTAAAVEPAQGSPEADLRQAGRRRQDHRQYRRSRKDCRRGRGSQSRRPLRLAPRPFGDTALKLISGGVALRFVNKKVEAVEL